MSTLMEIEEAAKRLPRSEQAILVQHLQGALQKEAPLPARTDAQRADSKGVKWPDFAGRLREIYGDEIMPNMVLEERESADR